MATKYRCETGFFPTLDRAWRKLHKVKILGKRGACCGSCSNYEVGEQLWDETYDDYIGYVHYNVQSRDNMKFFPENGMYVGFGTNWVESPYVGHSAKAEELTANYEQRLATAVGFVLKLHFESYGLEVEWNGSPRTSLRLRLPKEDK